ncbi:hypothetical protein [Konateibacter massiliensis]|uniref:hypothetical protein n=1 Tax=Konateibacter massiliensis TaxID=2002841 RepID=UPI0015D4F51F|nr:hypothetical protein [Konateibacter massiliensis]
MGEKAYKAMGGVGALNITVGIIVIVVGVVSGILLIVGGGRLHKNKSEIIF